MKYKNFNFFPLTFIFIVLLCITGCTDKVYRVDVGENFHLFDRDFDVSTVIVENKLHVTVVNVTGVEYEEWVSYQEKCPDYSLTVKEKIYVGNDKVKKFEIEIPKKKNKNCVSDIYDIIKDSKGETLYTSHIITIGEKKK